MTSKKLIHNPYAGVDWGNHTELNADLHAHQDLDMIAPHVWDIHEFINRFHEMGYDVLLTGFESYPWTAHGIDPEELNMIPVRQAEYKGSRHHLVGLFTDYVGSGTNNYNHDRHGHCKEITKDGGYMFWPHPGRYIRLDRGLPDYYYYDYYKKYDRLLGQELYNRGKSDFNHNRRLWDYWLSRFAPYRSILGFSNTDAREEAGAEVGTCNLLITPNRTKEEVKKAIINGTFFLLYDPNFTTGSGFNCPKVQSISVEGTTINISASNYDKIEWFSNREKVGEGESINYNQKKVWKYLRAILYNGEAETCTQPFMIETPRMYNFVRPINFIN